MASGTGSHARISPRKFSEKIALLNKKEREANAKFEEIIKEVHATKGTKLRGSPGEQADGRPGLPPVQRNQGPPDLSNLTQAELQFQLSNSTNYKAAHADSLEEIEKVYENLIKSVGQYDAAGDENRNEAANRTTVLHYNDEPDKAKLPIRSSSAGFTRPEGQPTTDGTNTSSPAQPGNHFYQQIRTPQNVNYQAESRGACCDQPVASLHQESMYPNPYQQQFANNFLPHHALGACVSTSCIPQQQQQQQPLQNLNYLSNGAAHPHPVTGRARVVSFGSASRAKFPCPSSEAPPPPSEYPIGHQHQQSHERAVSVYHVGEQQRNHQHPNQYLKEPSGDRSRQKSCSEPQLHTAQPGNRAHQHVSHVLPCKSDNRLATPAAPCQASPHLDSAPSKLELGLPSPNQGSHKSATNNNNNNNNMVAGHHHIYTNDEPGPSGNVAEFSGLGEPHYLLNHAGEPDSPGSLQAGCCRDGGCSDQQHHYVMCDTTTSTTANLSRSQLPGIKICAIDDESSAGLPPGLAEQQQNSQQRRQQQQVQVKREMSTSKPSSRDGSLPDITKLKFSSVDASPERGPVYQGQDWPAPQDERNRSLVAMEGNWPAYAMENVDMEIQVDSSQEAVESYRQRHHQGLALSGQQEQQLSKGEREIPSQQQSLTAASICERDSQAAAFAQPTVRVNNALSSSDCGFGPSSFHQTNHHQHPGHHQQGKLMICASSDLYNNIMRSRSHNSIISMSHKKSASHHRQAGRQRQMSGNLPPFEQRHHTSQYCLQTGHHQPLVNVRRISELKTHGTSTSPLDSSSNLNSPQSEMNSPGSSTTDQCEPAMMFAGANQQQHHQHNRHNHCQPHELDPAGALPSGSNSTLVPDPMNACTHYQAMELAPLPLDLDHSRVAQINLFMAQSEGYAQSPDMETCRASDGALPVDCDSQGAVGGQEPTACDYFGQSSHDTKFAQASSTATIFESGGGGGGGGDVTMDNDNR